MALVIEKGVVGSSAVKRVAYLMGVDEWSVLGRLTALWEASQELDKCVASGDEIGFWVGAKSREESAQWAAALADPLAGFMRAREDGTFEIRGNKKHIEKVRAVKDANRERVMKRWRKGTENTAGTTITPPNDTAGIPPVQKSDTAPIPELNQAKPSQAELNQANKKQKRAPGAQEPSDAALGSSDGQSPISLTWKAYRDAYERRHRAAPPWNAKHAGQIAQFVKRIPAAEAPSVAEFFVGHNSSRYVSAMHPIGMLLQDAEKLRTEWITGRRMTSGQARSEEVRGNNAEFFRKRIQEAENGQP